LLGNKDSFTLCSAEMFLSLDLWAALPFHFYF
jgi:hypothetical protein